MHLDLMVAATQVQLRKESRTTQLVDYWNWVHAAHRLGIESTVVDAKVPGVVVLLHQEHRRRESRRACVDYPLGHHVLALALELIFDDLGVAVGHTATGAIPGNRWM
jgi:hypothetical protein